MITDWLTSIGTVGAVIASVYFATRDEVRRVNHERRAQAEQITAWLGADRSEGAEGFSYSVTVQNASNQCAYRTIARLVRVHSSGNPEPTPLGSTERGMNYAKIGLLPPGRSDVRILFPGFAAGLRIGVELAFQDAAGRYWIRRPNGRLDEIKQDPVQLYGFHEPFF